MALTVTSHFTRAIVQTMAERGRALPAALQARLEAAEERLPLALLDEIWLACEHHADDPLFGLRAGLNVQPGHLDVVGFLLMSCETLGDALEALMDYHRIVGEGGDFSETRRGGECTIIYAPHYEKAREQRVSAVMASALTTTRWLTGGKFQPKRIAFAHAPPPDTDAAADLLQCPLSWNEIADVLVFEVSQLDLPIVQANAQVHARMRVLADEALGALTASGFSRQVADLIRAQPAASKEDIAEKIHMSGRHLNRKLAEQGVSFKLLQDQVRDALAAQWLDAGEHVMDVAARLGFSDERGFVKAFKRWRNMTPAQFRQR